MTKQDVKELADISFKAHVEFMSSRLERKDRLEGFLFGAVAVLGADHRAGSYHFEKHFNDSTLKLSKKSLVGAIAAKTLYCEIYGKLSARSRGRSAYLWIEKL